eukprot:14381481-Ditylum_brightwellii.AAC.2
MKDYIGGVYRDLAVEIKIAVVSFWCVPTGFSQYNTIIWQSQSINKKNSFGKDAVTIYNTATGKL